MSNVTATACPKCETDGFAKPSDLAAHLIDGHDMAGIAALALARKAHQPSADPPQLAEKGATMKPCTICSKTGHRSDNRAFHPTSSPKAGTERVAKKKQRPITRQHPEIGRKAKAKQTGVVSEITALSAVAAALESLGQEERVNVIGCVCKLLKIKL